MVARMVGRMALDVGDDFVGGGDVGGEVGDEGGCEDGGDESAEDYNKVALLILRYGGFAFRKNKTNRHW